jgi:hypothetical protein
MRSRLGSTVPRRLREFIAQQLDAHVNAHLSCQEPAWRPQVPRATGSRVGNHNVVAGIPIYTASLSRLASKGIRELQPAGWLLLVHSFQGLTAQLEVQERDKKFVLVRVSVGLAADHLEKAVAKARSFLTPRRGSRVQLRALRVAAMHIFALWVHHHTNLEQDVFIPFTANFAGLHRRRLYKRKTAERLLTSLATAMIVRWYEQNHSPRDDSGLLI